MIIYGDGFPFEKPIVRFAIDRQFPYICLFDLQKLDFRDFMKEDYHPSLNFAEIAQRSLNFLNKNVIFINVDPAKEEDAAASKAVVIENRYSAFYRFIAKLHKWDEDSKGALHW